PRATGHAAGPAHRCARACRAFAGGALSDDRAGARGQGNAGRLGGWALRWLRGRFCDCVLERGDPLLKVVRALKSGRVLYYLPDEDHGRRRRAVFVPYFGRKVCTVLGSGRLVALTRAQVLPCLATLDPATGSYRVSIEAPLRDLPYDDP